MSVPALSTALSDSALGEARRLLLPDPSAQINCPWKGYSTISAQRCRELTGTCGACPAGTALRAGRPLGGKTPVLVDLSVAAARRGVPLPARAPAARWARPDADALADYLREDGEATDARILRDRALAAAASAPPVLLSPVRAAKIRRPPRVL